MLGRELAGRGLGLVNEWELAQAAFEQAVQLDGNNAEAWAWLGEAKQQTGGGEAFTDLERAVDLNPISAVVRGLRGLYFQRVGNNREALAEFQSAAALEPNDPNLYVAIGESYSKPPRKSSQIAGTHSELREPIQVRMSRTTWASSSTPVSR